MLSYRHSFHAGNFADVLKHYVLVEILEALAKKDKPFEYIDTHAGAGLHYLHSEQAQKLAAEFAERSPDAVLASKRVINAMYDQPAKTLYKEKAWQLKMMLGRNRKLALRKAKQASTLFGKRQFR